MITEDPQHDETFEDRLGAQLRAFVSERPAPATAAAAATASAKRRRAARPAIALSAVATTAAAGALLIPGGSPAYAVEGNADGTVTIEIKDLTDAGGLERDLAEAGVPAVVSYLPPGKICEDGRFERADIRTPIKQGFNVNGTGSLTVRPADFASGSTLVLTSAVGKDSTVTTIGVAKGKVGKCVEVTAGIPALPALPETKDGKLHQVTKSLPSGEAAPSGGEADLIIGGSSEHKDDEGPGGSVSGSAGAPAESADR